MTSLEILRRKYNLQVEDITDPLFCKVIFDFEKSTGYSKQHTTTMMYSHLVHSIYKGRIKEEGSRDKEDLAEKILLQRLAALNHI